MDEEARKRAFENFRPKANPPGIIAKQQPMSAKPIDINNPDELRTLAKSKLVEIIQTSPTNVSLVTAIRELLDRVDGKPVGSSPNINIGATGDMKIEVVLVPSRHKQKVIDG